MGLLRRLAKKSPRSGYNPKTASRPQNSPRQIEQGEGGPAAESQIQASPSPFDSKWGAANYERGPVNNDARLNVGDGKSRNRAGISGHDPMSDREALSRAGYSRPPRLVGYRVHNPEHQSNEVGTRSPRGRRQASGVVYGPKTTGRKRLVQPMDNDGWAEGAKLYRERHPIY